ncbi:MFS family permease [Arcanobacterium pluranimalium]|uniref:MFS transporter n=1 Tax=Arcanobacterium pluranimalium TaxID=108028 RepID=UPI0019577D8E|nr:MFS transporter [Arcanobacterium pluranimalium]MBM7825655.1 MFS family permease [Arcanobacterium pluranimalium]
MPDASTPNDRLKNSRYIKVDGSKRVYDRNRILIVLLVSLMMSLLQVSSVNTALAAMQESLKATDSQLQWVLSGYTLAIGITLVPAGRLGDMLGRSFMFSLGLAIFTVSSLALGFANSAVELNLLRFVQGLASGIFSPQITGLIIQYFNGRSRAKAFAYFGLVVSMSVAAGPVLSGLFIAFFGADMGWRLSFAFNAPLGIIGLLLALYWLPFKTERKLFSRKSKTPQRSPKGNEKAIPEQPAKSTHESTKHRNKIDLDPVGMCLLGIAVLAIMLPFMVKAPGWKWFIIVAGFALLGLWSAWEHYYKKRGNLPMVDLDLFRIKSFSYSTGISALQFLGAPSMFVVLAIFLQDGLGVSALASGLVTLPNALISAYAAMWAGKRSYDHGRGIQAIAIALILFGALGMVIVVWSVHHGASFWWFALPLVFTGFGGGAMGSANQTQAMIDVPASYGGTAGGVIQTAQRMATAIGTALVTAIFFATRGTPANINWYFGIATAYVVIAMIFIAALVLSFIFWRDGYHDRHAIEHKRLAHAPTFSRTRVLRKRRSK